MAWHLCMSNFSFRVDAMQCTTHLMQFGRNNHTKWWTIVHGAVSCDFTISILSSSMFVCIMIDVCTRTGILSRIDRSIVAYKYRYKLRLHSKIMNSFKLKMNWYLVFLLDCFQFRHVIALSSWHACNVLVSYIFKGIYYELMFWVSSILA